jgi:class 3 adenylate cyclase/tetratricopeptide (TPR) repeat protein
VTESLSAETRLERLLGRLLTSAEAALAAGDLDTARATAEEVQAVDPANSRALALLAQVSQRQRGSTGERALMTLLFSDLVGSTRLSERLEPERLRDMLAFYRAEARQAVERYGGSVLKYMGDGILAGFGYPEPHEDDGRRAVLAGLDMVAAMHRAEAEMRRTYGEAPQIRVGVHTGLVVVADLSDARSSDEKDSIVGVTPNLAARIQQAAEPDTVVISDVTRHLVETDFYLHSLGDQHFKGISRPVEVFAVQRARHPGAKFYAERYRQGDLVGRDEQLARLVKAWTVVRDSPEASEHSAFVVAGEAGIGKTRLVAELVETVETSGGRVLGAGCLPYYSSVSLWPIGRLIERALPGGDDSDRLDQLATELGNLGMDPRRSVPFLGHLIGAVDPERFPAPELDPAAFLEETQSQLVDWLVALAGRTPRMLVVEDLHWADPSTIALLGRLMQRKAAGVLLLGTTRDPSGLPWADAVTVLELGRLDGTAADHLVTSLVAEMDTDGALSPAQRHDIVRQAEGIPLFVEELTRSYLADTGGEGVPLRLQELLAWRLKSPAVDPRVAQVAATVGPTFDAATVASVLGDGIDVAQQLEVLVDAGIVEPDDHAGRTYRFRHALMRDAAYETQLLDVRRSTHGQVADALVGQGGEPALVAQHLDLAGDAVGASAQYIAAAQAEQTRGAHTEASRLLVRAVDLLDGLPASQERDLGELTARMLHAFSVSSVQGYAAPEVQADHRRLEQLVAQLGTRPEVLPSLIAIWAYWFTAGELGTGRAMLERLSALVATQEYAWFEPEVESCLGYQLFYEGHLEAALEHLHRSIEGFDARPADQLVSPFWPLPNDPLAVAPAAVACVNALRGDVDQVEPWITRGVERSRSIGFPRGPFSEAFVKVYAAWGRRFLRDLPGSMALGGEVVSIGMEYGYTYWMLLGSSYLGTPVPGSGPDVQFLEQNVATLQAVGQMAFAASNVAQLAQLYAEQGDVDRAAGLIDEALEIVHKTGEYVHLPELLRMRGDYTLARFDDAEQAAADYVEAVAVASEQGARVSRLRAAVALASLPQPTRPSDWREVLDEACSDLPAAFATSDEAAAARTLLAG